MNIIRHIQRFRKELKLTPSDKIELFFKNNKIIPKYQELIIQKLGYSLKETHLIYPNKKIINDTIIYINICNRRIFK